jgi:hypothetical protein
MNLESDSTSHVQNGSHAGCHYIDGLLAVRPRDIDTAVEFLRSERLDSGDITDDVLADYLGDAQIRDDRGEPPIRVLSVPENPHRAAAVLVHRKDPIPAAPIHGLGYESHGKYMSGEGPRRVKAALSAPPKEDLAGWIAVVDSGLVREESRPEWMRDPYVQDHSPVPEDVRGDDASHGTFVTSLIRRVAPNIGVAFAAAPPDLAGKLVTETPGEVTNPPTTELDVLGAVSRLIAALGSEPSAVKALNLSLGAAQCGPSDSFLLTLRSAIDLWRNHFGHNAPVFAAGGNSDDPYPVYPAALDCVRGVGAGIDEDVDQRVWDDNGDPVVARNRYWIDDVAPGLGLRGLGGGTESDVVEWSGSSFASAVASALHVQNASFVVHDGVVYWQDRPVSYRRVVGIQN